LNFAPSGEVALDVKSQKARDAVETFYDRWGELIDSFDDEIETQKYNKTIGQASDLTIAGALWRNAHKAIESALKEVDAVEQQTISIQQLG